MLIYVGFDRREQAAWEVAKYSILKHAHRAPVILPLVQDQMRAEGIYKRPKDMLASTDFSLTRFFVPVLADRWNEQHPYDAHQWALYVDCDFLFTVDIKDILRCITDREAPIYMVKHNYSPKPSSKMDNRRQILYPRKNWCSLILFDLNHPRIKETYTLDWLNSFHLQIPDLNEFKTFNDDEIGGIDIIWNFLVGEYTPPEESAAMITEPTPYTPKGIHFTRGGPWIEGCEEGDYHMLWDRYRWEFENLNR